MKDLGRFSFGTTSSVTTSLALIVGLDSAVHPKLSIISALAVLAIADNISDSLGIHMYRESENAARGNLHTITNFLTRLVLTALFALIVFIMRQPFVVPVAVAMGIIVLSVLSYGIARSQLVNPGKEILKHLGIAVAAMAASHFVGAFILQHVH